MKIVIDISKDRYNEIMAMDWKNCRLLFAEELRAIHDGKALEQEPCDDCISRSATLDAIIKRLGIKNETYLLEAERVIYQQILAMPSVTPQPNRWIPVSEGLPEIHNFCQLYLVTYKQGQICTAFYTETNGRSWWSIDGVEAWMPLPEPYKQEVEK